MKDGMSEGGRFTPKAIVDKFRKPADVTPALAGAGVPIVPNTLESRVIERPPVEPPRIPGGRPTPSPDHGGRPRHTGRKAALATALTGVVAGGGYVGYDALTNRSQTTETPPATTLIVDAPVTTIGEPITVAPTVSPTVETVTQTSAQPVPTEAPTTVEPTTTIPERTFASPEQQVQVESVEANMEKFFTLTPADLEAFKTKAIFTPYPDGFSTVMKDSELSVYRVIGIDLGTFPITAGNGRATMHVFGCITEDGNKYVVLETLEITDPDFANGHPWYAEGRGANVMNPSEETGRFGTTNEYDRTELLDHTIYGMTDLITTLNESVGQPIIIEYSSDPILVRDHPSFNYPANPNPNMREAHDGLNQSFTRTETLARYSSTELEGLGIYTEPEPFSQTVLNGFPTVTDLVSSLPLNQWVSTFNNVPSIL